MSERRVTKSYRTGSTLAVLATAALLPASLASAINITVDPAGAIKSINAAYQAANPGDTIIVKPGTYYESLSFDKSVNLVAQPGAILDASRFTRAITGTAQNVSISGLTVNGAANYLQSANAAVRVGTGWTLDGVTVQNAQAQGIGVMGDNVRITNTISQNNGQNGIGGSGKNIVVKDSITRGNNKGVSNPVWAEPGNTNLVVKNGLWYAAAAWEGGGGKWSNTENLVLDNVTSYLNNGPGIWLDYSNKGYTVENSKVFHNNGTTEAWEGVGIWTEINDGGGVIRNNIVGLNSGSGINVAESSYVDVTGNVLLQNGIELRNLEGRGFTTSNVLLANNTIESGSIYTSVGLWTPTSFDDYNIRLLGNQFDTGVSPESLGVSYLVSVPEPTSLALLGLGSLAMLRRRSRD